MTRSLYLAPCLALLLLLAPAAAQQPVGIQAAYVYKPDGTRHCDASPEVSLDSMAEELIRSGIPVHMRRKSHDGREGVAVCGNPTGSINVYEIGESDVPKALELGFRHLDRSWFNPR
jgi:hypothetical protein